MRIIEPAKKYSFWFRGGHVIDPAEGIDHAAYVVVSGDRIAPLPESGTILLEDVREIIDCTGCYVFPGLIDNHVHSA